MKTGARGLEKSKGVKSVEVSCRLCLKPGVKNQNSLYLECQNTRT